MIPRRGNVYLVSFDPAIGAEIRKTRPAVVVQNDVANRHSPITIVAAVTSRVDGPSYPTEVRLPAGTAGSKVPSAVLTNQLRSMDRGRLIRRIGALDGETMREVDRALAISLGMVRL